MNICYVMCGIAGSGKSTLSKQLAKQHKAKLLCFDDMPESRISSKSRQAHEEIWRNVAEEVKMQDVVFDDLNTTIFFRRKLMEQLSQVDCKKILYVMTTPLEECLKRNANRQGIARLPDFVINGLYSQYERPTLDEGWDEIIYV
ncbi:MAG: ATP-binding protein [Erysipelotrichaceae bacterium]|nr:ATP-binding protein [Erysipelotrichaceae bacterium]